MITATIRVSFIGGPLDGAWCDFYGSEIMPVGLWATVIPINGIDSNVQLDAIPAPGVEHYQLEVHGAGFRYRWGR